VIEAGAGQIPRTGAARVSARFVSADGIRILQFGDDAIVFNPISWDAHLLNAAAVEVLVLLAEVPRCIDDVVAFLSETLLAAEQADAFEHAQKLLHEFELLGLVRRLKDEPLAGC